jgi:signal transduction histidine kinase
MNSPTTERREWTSWAGVSLLVLLCSVLAILQYRWIGEVANAERQRLQEDLQSRLNLLRRGFDDQVSSRLSELIPSRLAIETRGWEQAWVEQYRRAQESKKPLANRIGLAIPEGDSLQLETPDSAAERFTHSAWPSQWAAVREQLLARMQHQPFRSLPSNTPVAVFPQFDPAAGREQGWLIVELNVETLRSAILPALLNRYLASEGRSDYDAEVVTNAEPPEVIFRSGTVGGAVDASVMLLDLGDSLLMRGREPGPGRGLLTGPPHGFRIPPEHRGPPPLDPGRPTEARGPYRPFDRGQWTLRVHHHAGSLEAIVAQARSRNMLLSGAILLLILTVAASLVRLSRQLQRMAEMEMNFVAGVSHELRTPLTVIRTAAYNLCGKIAHQPEQVERYGQLIQQESEKLTALVEDVLRYGSARAGQVIRRREPVAVKTVIQDSLRSARNAAHPTALAFEEHVQPQLPKVMADQVALQHVIQNLVENAVKHGSSSDTDAPWVGIFAETVPAAHGCAVEIRVADRGAGIPPGERERIFDPFFRGRRALADQIHGTGLGLNLVKKIVEAHGGTIEVKSEPMHGAEFIIRLPAAPEEFQQHEFAHSLG